MENKSLQRNALLIAALSSFLTPFMASSVVVALPRIGSDLSMSVLGLSWISTAYLLAAAAFLVPFGRLSDIYGRKRVFIIGILLDIVSSIVGACSTSGAMLITARILQGIGGGMILTLGVSIVTSVFPPERRGRALGLTVAAVYVGLSLGPFVGGFLTGHLGWRTIFLANVLIGMVILISVMWKLKGEWADARGEKFDFGGSLVYIASLVSLMYGLSVMPGFHAFLLVILGIVGIVLFTLWQLRIANPLLEMRLFRHNRVLLFSNLAALINYSATYAVTFLMSLYLQYIKGFTPQIAGLILLSQPVMMAVFSPPAGWLSERLGARTMVSAGMAITVVGLTYFAFLGPNTSVAHLVVNLMMLGFGFALFASPNTSAIMGAVEKKYLGVVSGMLATMRVTGQMFSMGVVMVMFALFQIGSGAFTPAYYPTLLKSSRMAFAVFAFFCFIGVFASLARGKDRNEQT